MRRHLSLSVSTLVALLALCAWAAPAAAQVPHSLIQQGRLVDDSGEAVTGEVDLQVTLYDSETDFESEHILWEDELTVEADEDGFYTAILGDTDNPIDPPVLAGEAVWLGIAVNGADEMSPRFRLHSVPYATVSSQTESVSDDTDLPWDNLTDTPDGLDDGDDDTLGGMSCSDGQVARFDGDGWVCSQALQSGSVTASDLQNTNVLYEVTASGCDQTDRLTLDATCSTQECPSSTYYYQNCDGTCDYGQTSAKNCNNDALGHLVQN